MCFAFMWKNVNKENNVVLSKQFKCWFSFLKKFNWDFPQKIELPPSDKKRLKHFSPHCTGWIHSPKSSVGWLWFQTITVKFNLVGVHEQLFPNDVSELNFFAAPVVMQPFFINHGNSEFSNESGSLCSCIFYWRKVNL